MFKMIYWLPNQSKLYSEPQCYETESKEDFLLAIRIAKMNGYEIEYTSES